MRITQPARISARTWSLESPSICNPRVANPRHIGRHVWNKQRKDEVLLDVNDVVLGYETRMRWNDKNSWVWSDAIAHPALAENLIRPGGAAVSGS